MFLILSMVFIPAPFKFDIPSPDDVISNRLHSTKITPKGRLYDCKRLLSVL